MPLEYATSAVAVLERLFASPPKEGFGMRLFEKLYADWLQHSRDAETNPRKREMPKNGDCAESCHDIKEQI